MDDTKFAFILTGGDKHKEIETIRFNDENNTTKICGVKDIDAACVTAKQLVDEGYNLIELCGDFNKEGAMQVVEAVDNKAKVGYVIYLED